MSNTQRNLIVVPPETMNPEGVLEWIRNRATVTSKVCAEAQDFWKKLKEHHEHIAELMAMMSDLKENKNAGEDVEDIVDATMEVLEAIESLKNGENLISATTVPIDEMGKNVSNETRNELHKVAQDFLTKYNRHKARLGLDTQQKVAELTGIDRRYISLIERGTHRPQFRTIKRIADAFGIKVEDLL